MPRWGQFGKCQGVRAAGVWGRAGTKGTPRGHCGETSELTGCVLCWARPQDAPQVEEALGGGQEASKDGEAPEGQHLHPSTCRETHISPGSGTWWPWAPTTPRPPRVSCWAKPPCPRNHPWPPCPRPTSLAVAFCPKQGAAVLQGSSHPHTLVQSICLASQGGCGEENGILERAEGGEEAGGPCSERDGLLQPAQKWP